VTSKRRRRSSSRHSALLVLLLGAWLLPVEAWEPTGQRLVTAKAIDALPYPLQSFFEAHRQRIVALAADPSQWDAADRKLTHHGFLQLDAYGEFPYNELPRDYNAAVAKFTRKKVTERGVLPWQIGLYSLRLTDAFQEGDPELIIQRAAVLAHYVAEAHDPFNTTRNFDGSRSGQPGADARYARSLVQRYQMFFVIRPAPPFPIKDPTAYAFSMLLEAHSWLQNILLADSQARAEQADYNDAYYDNFYDRVGAILVRQLTHASLNISSYWYTAWLNAGSPPLPR
jgi:hypothetical protein